MTIGSLFSGIGGLEKGLERAGLGPVVWQCEREPFPRQVLAKHWPGVHCYDDVRTMGVDEEIPYVDIICGGFPCQDLSPAGKRSGLAGERSGLWSEFRRLIDEQRPEWVVIENTHGGWRGWVPFVRRDLWTLGYASVPFRVRADQVGTRVCGEDGTWYTHERARCFLVAHADRDSLRIEPRWGGGQGWAGALESAIAGQAGEAADAQGQRLQTGGLPLREGAKRSVSRKCASGVADPDREGPPIRSSERGYSCSQQSATKRDPEQRTGGNPAQPLLVRGLHGVSHRVDRIKALGNAVVPQVAEVIGRIIKSYMEIP